MMKRCSNKNNILCLYITLHISQYVIYNLHAYTYIQAFLNIKEEYEGPYLVSTSSITLPPPPPHIAPLQTHAQTHVVEEGVVASVSTESIVLEELDYCDIEVDTTFATSTAAAANRSTTNASATTTAMTTATAGEGQQYTSRPMLRGVILLHVTEGGMTARFYIHDNIPTRASLLL